MAEGICSACLACRSVQDALRQVRASKKTRILFDLESHARLQNSFTFLSAGDSSQKIVKETADGITDALKAMAAELELQELETEEKRRQF